MHTYASHCGIYHACEPYGTNLLARQPVESSDLGSNPVKSIHDKGSFLVPSTDTKSYVGSYKVIDHFL